MSKPFSPACENNRQYILDRIRHEFTAGLVLEIGTLTAQHVTCFAEAMPHVRWQPSDIPSAMATVQAGLADNTLPNILPPVPLDVTDDPWPVSQVDGIFSANTLHIMPLDHVASFFRGAGRVLRKGGKLCVYGPFKYGGEFTTPSNARFDQWLKERDPDSGVRDIEQLLQWAQAAGLQLLADHSMPANNQLLVWQKII